MNLETWLAFVLASTILLATPGPSVLVVVAHGIGAGWRKTLATIAGVGTADVTHVVIASSGLDALMAISADVFSVIRWAGVAYLIYLGIRQWRAASALDPARLGGGWMSARTMYMQGFAITFTNPKSIYFFVAFFPQFLDADTAELPHFVILGATFVAIALVVLIVYAGFAGRIRGWLGQKNHLQLQNRITGTLFIGAGMALAAFRRS